MEIYDVSVPVREAMPVYDGNPGVSLSRAQSIAAGDHANVTRLELGAHTGTHVDAPLHRSVSRSVSSARTARRHAQSS